MRSTPSRHDDVECTGSFRRCRRRHWSCITVRAHLARLLLLGRGSDFLLPMLDLCMQAHARARRSASSRNSGRRQSFRRPASALRWCIARCCADASAGPSAGMTATASTTTSAGETFRAALGSGGKGGRRPRRSGVRWLRPSEARRRRPSGFGVRARAQAASWRVWRSAIFHTRESAGQETC